MKRSNTHSATTGLPTDCRTPGRGHTPSRAATPSHGAARAIAPVLVAAFALVVFGCVTSGQHEIVVAERDTLEEQHQALAQKLENARVSNQSLAQDLETLLEDFEDVRVSRADLEERVSALSATERQLSEELQSTSTELEISKNELARTSAEVEVLNSTYVNLVSDLESELAAGQIQIEQLKEGLRVNVADDVLFGSGSAKLDSVGREVLVKVANQLVKLDHNIEVQGHTDDVPIRGGLTKRFPTNWELAAARAARVARLLQEQGVDGERLIVASFAEFKPLGPNDSNEGRAMNRRIEIRLLPIDAPVADTQIVEGDVADATPSNDTPAPGSSEPAPPDMQAPAAKQ